MYSLTGQGEFLFAHKMQVSHECEYWTNPKVALDVPAQGEIVTDWIQTLDIMWFLELQDKVDPFSLVADEMANLAKRLRECVNADVIAPLPCKPEPDNQYILCNLVLFFLHELLWGQKKELHMAYDEVVVNYIFRWRNWHLQVNITSSWVLRASDSDPWYIFCSLLAASNCPSLCTPDRVPICWGIELWIVSPEKHNLGIAL